MDKSQNKQAKIPTTSISNEKVKFVPAKLMNYLPNASVCPATVMQ